MLCCDALSLDGGYLIHTVSSFELMPTAEVVARLWRGVVVQHGRDGMG